MVDPAPEDAEAVDGKEEIPADESDRPQDSRMRVEEAQLPNDVPEAALGEVGKTERPSDHDPESDDIRASLDTSPDLPWSTKATDWIDTQESRKVEATLRRLIEPAAVADLEEGRDEVEAAAAEIEEGDAAEVVVAPDLEEGDTADIEAVVAEVEKGDDVEAAADDIEEGDTAEVAAAADPLEGDTADVAAAAELEAGDTAVVDIEKADTAPGPHYDDTVETPAVVAVISEGPHPPAQLPESPAQLPEQQVAAPKPVQTPEEKRRYRSLALAALVLAALLIGTLLFFYGVRRDGSVSTQPAPAVTAAATATGNNPTSESSDESAGIEGGESTIQLDDFPDSGKPFEIVRIKGTYRGGPNTFLQLQFWQGGEWLAFPLPSKTNQAGQFTAHAEFDQPGSYRLRVLDPHSGVTSKTFVLVIEG